MTRTLDDRLRRLEERHATRLPTYRAIYRMKWRESIDEAWTRAVAEGIESIGLLLPEDAPSIEEWEKVAREHRERINGATR